ncbi:MAG TPA: HypC/HybG/HupF family hydrogenase formation chaperone [Thermoleophilia bacterium]|nr:HypC/HybG/HupF family hydrogenase formation chaperone [Thermoleophilia bacterium]
MCLAIPARIEEIDGLNAVINLEGVRRRISLLLCPEAQVGEYALVHAGFAISVIDEEQAQAALEPWEEMRTLIAEAGGGGSTRGPAFPPPPDGLREEEEA